MLEQRSSKDTLFNTEALSDARKVPDRLDGELGHVQLAGVGDTDPTIWHKTACFDALLELGDLHVCLCHGDGRSDVDVLVAHNVVEDPGRQVAERVHGYNLLLVAPSGEGADDGGGFSVGEVRPVVDV